MIDVKDISDAKINQLDSLIAGASKAGIITHIHPDGDAMGSSTAMFHYLRDLHGLEAKIIISDRYPESLAFMIDEETLPHIIVCNEENGKENASAYIDSCDLLFCLDCNCFERTGDVAEMFRSANAPKVLIDHHLNPDRPSFVLSITTPDISSASEMLFQTLMHMPDIQGDASKLPGKSCYSLMVGLTTDTNNFANSVVNSTWAMAAALLSTGVDRDEILGHLYNEYRENRLRLMGYLLHEGMHITDDGVAYVVLDAQTAREYDIRDGELEGFVNMPLSIKSVRMSIFARQDKGFFRISIRSKKGTSANGCANRYFHGGGHELAAGGRLYLHDDIARPEDASDYIVAKTKEFFANV